MTREQAINYLKSSGMSDEQIGTVVDVFTCEDAISRQAVLGIIEDDKQDGCYSCFEDAKCFEQKVREIPSVTPKTDLLDKIRAEIEKLNPVDYGSIYSYESHNGAREIQNDVLDIIDKYAESEVEE